MNTPRLLIACIGNIFLGDDAFGVELAQHMARRDLPDNFDVIDFGIRGLDLAYTLLDGGYSMALLVDAAARGEAPGTLYVIEHELTPQNQNATTANTPAPDSHGLHPAAVLELAYGLGAELDHVMVVGCEPSPPAGPEDLAQGLTPPVRAAINHAVPLIESLAHEMIRTPAGSPVNTAHLPA